MIMQTSFCRVTKGSLVLIVATLVSGFVIGGCNTHTGIFSTGGPVESDQARDTFNRLMQRPDIDQAQANYEAMSKEIRESLGREVPALSHWQPEDSVSRSGCDPDLFPGVEDSAETRILADQYAHVQVTNEQYDQALQIIGSVVRKYGFDPKPQRISDRPNGRYASFHNPVDGGRVDVVTNKSFILGFNVGCYLTPEAKKRGHP